MATVCSESENEE